MRKDLSKLAKQKKIKYFLISFVDLFGILRSKLVPARAISEMQKNGAGFAGFATWLDMTPADSDMFAIPDPNSLIQLPWNKEVGWLASDLWMNGKPVKASPRVMLKNQIDKSIGKNVNLNKIIFAYEPIWSIGTGKILNTSELSNIIKFIKRYVKNRIKSQYKPKVLYGGSVNHKNIRKFNLINEIDGFLIGGASISSKKFIDIIKNYYKQL